MPSVHPPSVRSPDQENGSARTQCKCAPGKSRYLQRLKALGSYDYSRVKLQPPLKHSGQDVGIFRNYGANSFKQNVWDHHYFEIIYLECVFLRIRFGLLQIYGSFFISGPSCSNASVSLTPFNPTTVNAFSTRGSSSVKCENWLICNESQSSPTTSSASPG